jgi:hypothetical protein
MTSMRRLAALLPVAGLVACGASAPAPWLTSPGIDGHAVYLPLRGTAHDPSGAASDTSCEGCHPGTSFREFVCTGCHTAPLTDPLHAAATGYVAGAVTSADCYRCHPQGAGFAPADHARLFPIGTAAHPSICGTCHTDLAARSDPSRLACVSCHQARPGFATAHANVRDYPVAVSAPWCLRCHADGQVDRVADHGRRAGPPGTGGPGDGDHDTHCFTCHSMVPPYALFGGPGPGVPDRPWAQDWTQSTCRPCH